MPRTAVGVQEIGRNGLTPVYYAANSEGNSFQNDGRTFLHVKNAGTGQITVTIATPGSVDGLAIADRAVTVAQSSEKMIGPFPPAYYNQSDGSVWVDWSSTTNVTFAALRL